MHVEYPFSGRGDRLLFGLPTMDPSHTSFFHDHKQPFPTPSPSLPLHSPSGPSSSSSASPIFHNFTYPSSPNSQNLDEFLDSFWTKQMHAVEREDMADRGASRVGGLPLARIKKVMKSDEAVKVGSALSSCFLFLFRLPSLLLLLLLLLLPFPQCSTRLSCVFIEV